MFVSVCKQRSVSGSSVDGSNNIVKAVERVQSTNTLTLMFKIQFAGVCVENRFVFPTMEKSRCEDLINTISHRSFLILDVFHSF